MFDFVARHKRLMQIFLAIVIVPTFAFFGIQSYDRIFSSGDEVTEVAGQKISVPEFNRALDQQRDTLRGMLPARPTIPRSSIPCRRARSCSTGSSASARCSPMRSATV